MLTFNFKRIFKSRGIDKPFSYLVNKGYSENVATRIANNKVQRFHLKDIEELCELFKCTPNDLLEWTPESNVESIENHPLVSIMRTDKVVELTKILNSVPLDRLNDIENMIKNELKRQ